MGSQMFSHRSQTYRDWHSRAIKGLTALMGAKRALMMPSSATGFMEAVARQCLPEGILCLTNGAFGEKFVRVMQDNGVSVDHVQGEWHTGFSLERFKAILDERPDLDAVAFVHNETSTGVLNPAREIMGEAKRRGLFVVVDAVTSLGGVPLEEAWGGDVIFAGIQKCFGLPPSLAVAAVSDAALERSAKATNKGYYFDLIEYDKLNQQDLTPTTPPVPQIMALAVTLEEILEMGKEAWFDEYQWRNDTIHATLRELGWRSYAEEAFRSLTVTAIKHPDAKSVTTAMEAKGFILASGYGRIKGETFRIGNMGHIPRENLTAMCAALREVGA